MTHLDDTFPDDPLDDEVAAWLQVRIGVPPPADAQPTAAERAAIRARIVGVPVAPPSPHATGIVAGSLIAFSTQRGSIRRVTNLAAAAVLVLLLTATLGAYLRTDDGERLPGAVATASVLPFAPGAALASPVAATCATDATLLLTPTADADSGAFASLPFPVAWYRDGTLTVQHGGEVLREIELPEGALLWPT